MSMVSCISRIVVLSTCLLLSVSAFTSELTEGINWGGIEFGFTNKDIDGVYPYDKYRENALMLDVEFVFRKTPDSPITPYKEARVDMVNKLRFKPTTNAESLEFYKVHNTQVKMVEKFMLELNKEKDAFHSTIDSNSVLSFEEIIKMKCIEKGDCLMLRVPRCDDAKVLNTESFKNIMKYNKISQNTIEGLWNFGGTKLLFVSDYPPYNTYKGYETPDYDYLKKGKESKNFGFMFILAPKHNTFNNRPCVYRLEKDKIVIFLDSDTFLLLPYSISKDGKTLQLNLRKKGREKVSCFDLLNMSESDSLDFVDSYIAFKKDSTLHNEHVQRHKKEFLNFVNESSYTLLHSQTGQTINTNQEEYKKIGLKYATSLLNKEYKIQVSIAALNCALDEEKAKDAELFVNEVKTKYKDLFYFKF